MYFWSNSNNFWNKLETKFSFIQLTLPQSFNDQVPWIQYSQPWVEEIETTLRFTNVYRYSSKIDYNRQKQGVNN